MADRNHADRINFGKLKEVISPPNLIELQLESWTDDESVWPAERDLRTFREWFRVEIHSVVVDVGEDDVDAEPAPSHGREDFDVWTANGRDLAARDINTAIPYTVDENGAFTEQAPEQVWHLERQGERARDPREAASMALRMAAIGPDLPA